MKFLKLIIICHLSLNCQTAVGQQGFNSIKRFGLTRCNDNSRVLDTAHQGVARDQIVIVIARLGVGDVRPNLNRRRLHNVRAYWTEFLSGESRRKPETIILAEGESVSGQGRLEFYVEGKLFEVLNIDRNRDLIVGECYPPDESYIRNGVFDACKVRGNKIFYPCRNTNVRRRSIR